MEKEKELYILCYEYLKRSKFKDNLPSFNSWYQNQVEVMKRIKEKRIERGKKKSKYAVIDYSEAVSKDIDKCIHSFKNEVVNKRIKDGKVKSKRISFDSERAKVKNPSLQQFKEYFKKYLKGEAWDWTRGFYLTCIVRLPEEDPEVLIKQFKELIREKRRNPLLKGVESFWRNEVIINKHTRTDDLKTYLAVYDLAGKYGYEPTKTKKGDTILQRIIEDHNQNLDGSLESDRKLYRIYLDKAKKIIKNLEGPFPKFPKY